MNIPEHNPRNGSGHPYTGKSYKQMSVVGHPEAKRADGILYEHRYLATKVLGKCLPLKVEIHHFGGGRHRGQLVICEDKAYHRLLHRREKAFYSTGDPGKRKCVFCGDYDSTDNLVSYFSKNHPNGRFHHASCKTDYEHQYWITKRKKKR